MAADFRRRGRDIVRGNNIWLHDFSIDGNRAALEARQGLPPYDRTFAAFTANNGIAATSVNAVEIR